MSLPAISAMSGLVAWGVALWALLRGETLHLVQMSNHCSSHVQPTPICDSLGGVVTGGIAVLQVDIRHTRRALGRTPPISVEERLRRAVQGVTQ